MLHLIKKDLLLQKKALPIVAVSLLFFAAAFSGAGSVGLVISTLALGYMLVYDAGLREDKSDGNKLLACLPIRKSIVVLSKYVSVYLYAALILIGNVVVRLAAVGLGLENYTFPITLEGAVGAMAALTVIFSIFFPLIFKLGFLKSRTINMIVLFVVVFAGTWVLSAVAERTGVNPLEAEPGPGVVFVMTAGVLALLTGSYFLSLSFYRKREF
jgi:hypothetical protein